MNVKLKKKMQVTENIDYFEVLLDKKKDNNGILFLDDVDLAKIKAAYDSAHDIRKFEINLYWQRSTILWTFIPLLAASFSYCMLTFLKDIANSNPNEHIIIVTLMIFISALGVTFSSLWFLMLQSSKYWQENWEFNISILEKYVSGNIHKIHFFRTKNGSRRISIHGIMSSVILRVFWLWVVASMCSLALLFNIKFNLLDLKSNIQSTLLLKWSVIPICVYGVLELLLQLETVVLFLKKAELKPEIMEVEFVSDTIESKKL